MPHIQYTVEESRPEMTDKTWIIHSEHSTLNEARKAKRALMNNDPDVGEVRIMKETITFEKVE